MALNKTYRFIAKYLTEFENHRLVRKYENALRPHTQSHPLRVLRMLGLERLWKRMHSLVHGLVPTEMPAPLDVGVGALHHSCSILALLVQKHLLTGKKIQMLTPEELLQTSFGACS